MEKVESRSRGAARTGRRLPIGPEMLADGGVGFRVWAPKRHSVQVVLFNDLADHEPVLVADLSSEAPSGKAGYYSGIVREATGGMYYGFRLDGNSRLVPDPASRFQPHGPDGLSQIIDPGTFNWSDAAWQGITIENQVLYEVHIGTLTREGTWSAAAARLPQIAAAGMTVIEVMPLADFPGDFGWGYDGICLFAPTRLYGGPDDFRRFVDRAHALGLGVILDVVYNHFGSIGCTVTEFADDYFSSRHQNEWGAPVNFDGENSGPVREFFLANVRYWIEDFHLDGFRFDATQSIFDDSDRPILTELSLAARKAAGDRAVIILAENEPQDVRLVRPVEKGGHGFNAVCNDDFHHAARVRLTGLTEAYYEDYSGSMDELRSAIRGGFLYQGQISQHQGKRRGTSARGLPPTAFIHFLQNHDQVANSGAGLRIHDLTSPGRLRAMTALWLLSPQTPMFFQGQEFAASSPFLYFADFAGQEGKRVAQGRIKFLSQFPSLNTEDVRRALADPADRSTFERSKLDWTDREKHKRACDFHEDLLKLRREDPVFRRQRADQIEAATLGQDCLAVRYFSDDETSSDRLLLVNFGRQLCYSPSPSPLLAPPARSQWELLWTSEHVRYGSQSTPRVEATDGWHIPAEAAVVLRAVARRTARPTIRTPFRRNLPAMSQQVIDQPTVLALTPSSSSRPLDDEWLVTNGLGGYASGTISGACTRRYHGLLIAALPVPLGRLMMLNHLSVEIILANGHVGQLDREELPDDLAADEAWLGEFHLEAGLPVWRYQVGPYRLEKRVLLPHLQNTVFVSYRLLEGPERVRLRLRPSIHFRGHDDAVDVTTPRSYRVTAIDNRFEIDSDVAPPLRMRNAAPQAGLLLDGGHCRQVGYRLEKARGYASVGSLWSPGYFRAELEAGQEACLIASTESWDAILSADPTTARAAEAERRSRLLLEARPEGRDGTAAELVLAADQFLIRPSGRVADEAQAQAAGDEIRSVIAGYHWFTDWGRDTMISLEGLTLMTGRQTEAGYILRTFARYVRDGLLPNLFPEGQREGLYHTADATLWFFHAVDRYVRASGDTHTLAGLVPIFRDIVAHHVRGTRFGIHVDPADGLLAQGDPKLPLTWMDAKVGDWVVTPRRGKAVEINALWYNGLRLLEGWCRQFNESDAAAELAERAQQTQNSFNDRFWIADAGYLYDVVDGEHGDDAALRPNQVFAISLDHPVLDRARWEPVLHKVSEHLLTPVGLRSLSPDNPDFKPKYDGDLRSRDAAYHQGTVWPWLIGPFVDAWLQVHPHDRKTARGFLSAFASHLNGACIGSISEVFDAEPPFVPRGCIAQAWSVAEVLRAWVKTEPA